VDSKRRAYLIEAAAEAQPYPPEAALAAAWLEAHIDQFEDIDWQKRVGAGVSLGPEYDANIQAMAEQATRKRVDLVAYRDGGAVIVELKDHVDRAAVRQANEYAELWQIAPGSPPVIEVRVVGRTGDAAIDVTAAALGVIVELLPLVPSPAPTP